MPKDFQTAEEMAAHVKTLMTEATDKVREIAQDALGKAEKGETLGSSAKEAADEALLKMNELREQVSGLEQKMARGGAGGAPEEKSIGRRFVEDEDVKAWLDGNPTAGKAEMRMKATITTATTDADGSTGEVINPVRGAMRLLPERRLTIRDLLPQGRMTVGQFEYPQETGFNNNAAPVAEGAVKPTSDLQLAMKTANARVIAHLMKVSQQALSDVEMLRSLIDQRLLYGLDYAEENQILNGDGTGQNLSGLMVNSTSYAAPLTLGDETSIDRLRLAMLQAALTEFPATAHVMNPIDWAWVELQKDTDGRYIIGNPQGSIAPTLWGLPVLATQAMAVDKFLTGAFENAQIFDVWDSRIETGYVNDDFARNLVTLRAEKRLALAVYRPEGFIYGDFGRVA
ncbi:phage major capsid protein [Wenxinia saemankumensis]|uniref:Phage major capsid protein, HK97 family n=1 Tax=Wenxinia saemankumensis TaxID=1447782 RepID=A0A1M6EZP3_9RHOB|nr:phage major capsid protein [Wenxinia saemankumensis]SHI90907.1 phage major capsid protein, HK97 family [Wenxinia saemankumensis]